jgi:hypothetical protein
MAKASNNPYPSVLVVEGAAPGAPASGQQRVFIDTVDHKFKRQDSTGSVVIVEGGLANPMTTQDDLIIGGSAGAPTRLGKGADGQVLTVDPTTHHLLWANAASGFANPMTTPGDLILGGTAGAAGRLAKGSDGQVLTVDPTSHLPLWAAAASSTPTGNIVYAKHTNTSETLSSTTTETTFPNLSASITIGAGRSIRVKVQITFTPQFTTGTANFWIRLGTLTYVAIGPWIANGATNPSVIYFSEGVFVNPGAGTYTVGLAYQVPSGDILIRPTVTAPTEDAYLVIEEV